MSARVVGEQLISLPFVDLVWDGCGKWVEVTVERVFVEPIYERRDRPAFDPSGYESKIAPSK